MRFIDKKTKGGTAKGKIALYCNMLHVTRQGFYWYLKHRDDPWKYAGIAEKMRDIVAEDECNDTYGKVANEYLTQTKCRYGLKLC